MEDKGPKSKQIGKRPFREEFAWDERSACSGEGAWFEGLAHFQCACSLSRPYVSTITNIVAGIGLDGDDLGFP